MDFQYTPSPFMLPTSHYDAKRADHAVAFIQNLKHTKGKWDGKPFLLLPWQEQIVRDIFGIVKADGKRQFRSAYVEIPKKTGSRNWRRPSLSISSMETARPVRKCMVVPMTGVRRPSSLMWQSGWWRNVRRF